MNPPTESKKNNLGATGEVVRRNVARLRGATQYKELSEKLSELGRPIHPVGLKRIEAGERRVDADDLMALAVVLGVAPNALLLPHLDDGELVEITGGFIPREFDAVWDWADGNAALNSASKSARIHYEMNSRPKKVAQAGLGDRGNYDLAEFMDAYSLLERIRDGEESPDHVDAEAARATFDRFMLKYSKKRNDGNS